MFKNTLKSNNGAALVVVLITLLVLSILTLSVIHTNMTNTKQVVSQKEHLQAYYLAYSGLEIGYSALLLNNGELLDEFKSRANHTRNDKVHYVDSNSDEIDITIKSSSDKQKITITSIGKHKASGKSVTLTMTFLADYPSLKRIE